MIWTRERHKAARKLCDHYWSDEEARRAAEHLPDALDEIERLRGELATVHAERDGAVSMATQAERELATLKVRYEKASHRAVEAASVVDLANSWARELGLQEAANPCGLRYLIDSLWAKTSQRLHDRACELAQLRTELVTAQHLAWGAGDHHMPWTTEMICFRFQVAIDMIDGKTPTAWEDFSMRVVLKKRKP